MPEKLDFITPTFMKVLGLFLSDAMGEYHEREVMRKSNVSKGSASRILHQLACLSFLTRTRKGRMVFYRFNDKEAVARQFKIVANVFALKKLTDRIRDDSRRIVLFGSCAQGTDVKGSDMDLFVLTSEKTVIRRVISEFNKHSDRNAAPIIVDANDFVRLRREDKPLHENIERGIPLWEKE